MSRYALISDGVVAAYPYSLAALITDNPGTSFPDKMDDDALADWGVFPVEDASRPDGGVTHEVNEIDPALVGGVWIRTWELVPLPLEEAKAALGERAKVIRDGIIEAGPATVPGVGQFDTDAASRLNVNGAVTMALIAQAAGAPFAIDWKLYDNTVVELDAAQMIAAGLAVGQHVSACHARAQALGLAIEAAEDAAALEAIDIGAGWPGGDA